MIPRPSAFFGPLAEREQLVHRLAIAAEHRGGEIVEPRARHGRAGPDRDNDWRRCHVSRGLRRRGRRSRGAAAGAGASATGFGFSSFGGAAAGAGRDGDHRGLVAGVVAGTAFGSGLAPRDGRLRRFRDCEFRCDRLRSRLWRFRGGLRQRCGPSRRRARASLRRGRHGRRRAVQRILRGTGNHAAASAPASTTASRSTLVRSTNVIVVPPCVMPTPRGCPQPPCARNRKIWSVRN